jgi:hypothetical protein
MPERVAQASRVRANLFASEPDWRCFFRGAHAPSRVDFGASPKFQKPEVSGP